MLKNKYLLSDLGIDLDMPVRLGGLKSGISG
jgi:hypothetical protein